MEMTLKEWQVKYEPCRQFETYGKDWEELKTYDIHNLWTVINEDEESFLINGVHLINRDFYLLTKNQWEENEDIIVKAK